MHAHVLRHEPFEGIGSIADWLAARRAHVTETRLYEPHVLPDLAGIDLLVIMGGLLSVNDVRHFPWLVAEKQFIRDAISRDVRVLGICLGSQLIASALGAQVRPNAEPEHGWFPVEAIAAPGEHFTFPAKFTTFHSHGDTFDIPRGAVHIARSEACEHQAFQYGRHVIALQFHLESTPQSARAIVEECVDEFDAGPYVQPSTELSAVPVSAYDESTRLMAEVLAYLTKGVS